MLSILTHNTQHERSTQRMSALVTLAVVGLMASGTIASADEPDAATQGYAKSLAIGVCGTCHGTTGNSTQPKFPRLAAQKANYLAAQLKNFRAQTRGDPDAIGYMWGMAAQLSDGTIDGLAQYYSSQKAEPSRRNASPDAARGKDIYEHGVPSEGVPACATCHGTDARGTADYPRLAGQHAQYVLKQLASFQSNMRNMAVMHGVAQNLRLQEMQSVAAFLEAQP